MHAKTIIASFLLAAGIVAADDTCYNLRDQPGCNWEGTAPVCDAGDHPVGYKDNGWTIVATSKDFNRDELRARRLISNECQNIYGSSCVTGWKNLWCPPQ